MNAVEKLGSFISRGVYSVSGPFHPFGGAVDIIVVQQPDGSFKSSPWYVRFGKFQGVFKTKEKIVTICVNGEEAGFHMYLDHKGEAHFLRESEAGEEESASSPTNSGDEVEERSGYTELRKIQNCNCDGIMSDSVAPDGTENGKILIRTDSQRSRNLVRMFGQRSMKGSEQDVGVERLDSLERAEIAANLLELKWSTNLLDCKGSQKKQTDKKHVPPKKSAVEKAERYQITSSDVEHDLKEKIDTSRGSIGDNNLETSIIRREVLEGIAICNTGNVRGEEMINEANTSECEDATLCDVCIDQRPKKSVENFISDSSGARISTGNRESFTNSCRNMVTGVNFEETFSQISGFSAHEKVLEVYTIGSGGSAVSNELTSYSIDVEQGEVNGESNCREVIFNVQSPDASVVQGTFEAAAVEVSNTKNREQEVMCCKNLESSSAISDISHEKASSATHLVFPPNSSLSDELKEHYEVLDDVSSAGLQKNLEFTHVGVSSLLRNFQNEPLNVAFLNGEFSVDFSNMVNKSEDSDASSIPPEELEVRVKSTDRSEEDDFLFNDIDGLAPYKTRLDRSLGPKNEKAESPMRYAEGDDVEEHPFRDASDAESSEGFLEDSNTRTSPVAIPRNKIYLEDSQISAKSLPTICSCIHDLDRSHQPYSLSRSLNLLYEKNNGDSSMERSEILTNDNGSQNKVMQENCTYEAVTAASDTKNHHKLKGSKVPPAVELPLCRDLLYEGMGLDVVSSRGNWKLWPFGFKRSKTINIVQPTHECANQEKLDAASMTMKSPSRENVMKKHMNPKKKVRWLTPGFEELASLNLKEGPNVVTFSFLTAMLGRQQVDARIYLWKWNTQIVISDVDGTITRSDVLGQFMPLVGMDWSQTGVAHLFSAIKENGYQLLFLSARAISQAYLTRQFLFNLKQDGKVLPHGPVVISPDGLFPSLYREVIRRAPHEFKISCLEAIRALFPTDCNPFYAGFGNRDTDEISYLKVGIPRGKIFIINPKGEVVVNRRIDTKSYSSLHALVNGMFPPMSSWEQEDFNSWNYWKMPLPNIVI